MGRPRREKFISDDKDRERNRDREQRILEAASHLIVQYGYDKTTVASIAEEAGISKGAVYLHFDSKESLFSALLYYEMGQFTEDLLRRIEADPESGSLGRLYSHSLMALAANPLLRALTLRDKRILGDFLRQPQPLPYGDMQAFSKEFIEEFQRLGLLRTDLTPDMIIYLLTVIRYGLLTVDEILPDTWIQSLDDVGVVLPEILQRAFAPPEAASIANPGGNREAGKRAIARFVQQSKEMLQVMREGKK